MFHRWLHFLATIVSEDFAPKALVGIWGLMNIQGGNLSMKYPLPRRRH
jgi:hypothetical protein